MRAHFRAVQSSGRWLALPLTLLLSCGARSQLIYPDVPIVDVQVPPDAPPDTPPDGPVSPVGLPPIDTTCPGACPYLGLAASFPPFVTLVPPDVPANCSNGFELGRSNGGCGRTTYTLLSTTPGGSRAITLDVDFATYLVADGVTVTGTDVSGHTYTLLKTCRLQTSNSGGPSNARPTNDTIRQFRVPLQAGTTRLDFDFGAVVSPMYIQVLGLCDFNVTPFTSGTWWQAVP